MASRIISVFTLFLSSFLSNSYVRAEQLPKGDDDFEIERQLKLLNKPAVTTVKTEYGNIYDCVDFYRQPAFDHPLLQNHTLHFQEKPNGRAKETRSQNKSRNEESGKDAKLGGIGCPHGTVPIRRTTKEDLIRQKLFQQIYDSNMHIFTKKDRGLHFAGVYKLPPMRVPFVKEQRFDGAEAYLSIHNTPSVGAFQFSSGLIKLSNGHDHIKAGWTVNPTLYGDTQTRFFIYLHAGNVSCFNTRCPGFVLVNPDLPVDMAFSQVSIPGVRIFETKIFIYREKENGNWWLEIGGETVGFWPKHIFTGLSTSAYDLFWGGEIFSLPKVKSSPMGSGIPLTKNPLIDAYCRRLAVVYEDKENKTYAYYNMDKISDFSLDYVHYRRESPTIRVFFGGLGRVFRD